CYLSSAASLPQKSRYPMWRRWGFLRGETLAVPRGVTASLPSRLRAAAGSLYNCDILLPPGDVEGYPQQSPSDPGRFNVHIARGLMRAQTEHDDKLGEGIMSPTLFSYCIPYDFGSAPNPFWGLCTLAICKPDIRRTANVGDWVVGTGSAVSPIGNISGKVVY